MHVLFNLPLFITGSKLVIKFFLVVKTVPKSDFLGNFLFEWSDIKKTKNRFVFTL